MNKTSIGFLSAVILLNTACSPKQEEAPGSSAQTSTASREIAAVTSSLATSSVTPSSVAASTAAAVTPAESPSPPNGGLLNINWKLIKVNEKEVTASNREPSILFNADNRVTGSDGCNSITGSYILDGEKLTLGEMAATRMACAEGGEQALAFSEALTKVASYTVHSDQLELRDATGLVIARFQAVVQP